MKQCILFEIFLQFSLPSPYTKLKLGKNSGYTRPTLFVGWGQGWDLCELENAPEMQKYPKTLVHVNNASNVSSFAMELDEFLVNYQIIASCQTNVSQALYQKKQTIKLTLKSCFSKPTIAIGFSVL